MIQQQIYDHFGFLRELRTYLRNYAEEHIPEFANCSVIDTPIVIGGGPARTEEGYAIVVLFTGGPLHLWEGERVKLALSFSPSALEQIIQYQGYTVICQNPRRLDVETYSP